MSRGERWLAAGAVALALSSPAVVSAAIREYFIAAEDVRWDFAPPGTTLGMGGAHAAGVSSPWAGHTRAHKVRYIEYTDATFATRKPQPEWLGVLGPIIRAEVGDTVRVHFWNRARGGYSMHPHGLRYSKDDEGAVYGAPGAGGRVPPGGRFTYTWTADEDSGPGPADPSSLVWWYHSHVNEPADVNRGLLGPIIVTGKGRARPDGTPADVDVELVVLFMIFNENRVGAPKSERGLMHSVNGYIFGGPPGLTMDAGQHVRWYLLGMGNETDLHTAHWHGKTVSFRGRRTDVIELLPGSMATADMLADNPGTWLFHCHVSDHIDAGMFTTFTVRPR